MHEAEPLRLIVCATTMTPTPPMNPRRWLLLSRDLIESK
jgi:hypothetical protein